MYVLTASDRPSHSQTQTRGLGGQHYWRAMTPAPCKSLNPHSGLGRIRTISIKLGVVALSITVGTHPDESFTSAPLGRLLSLSYPTWHRVILFTQDGAKSLISNGVIHPLQNMMLTALLGPQYDVRPGRLLLVCFNFTACPLK